MKQTKKYKLNLVEPSDTFSPDPLNQNMETVESALDTARAEAKAATDAVSKRVTTLEAHKVMWGTYAGDGAGSRKISLGYTPLLLLVRNLSSSAVLVGVVAKGHPTGNDLAIVDGGFTLTNSQTSFNHEWSEYIYIAYV